MANYEALMQELEGVLEAAQEANIMRQIFQILRDFFQSPFSHTQHIRACWKFLSNRDLGRLLVPKSDMESKILPLLSQQELEDLKNGVPVMIYGREGLGYAGKLKFSRPNCVLCGGWIRFTETEGLRPNDIITLWLFSTRHPRTHMLRFVVTSSQIMAPRSLPSRISSTTHNLYVSAISGNIIR